MASALRHGSEQQLAKENLLSTHFHSPSCLALPVSHKFTVREVRFKYPSAGNSSAGVQVLRVTAPGGGGQDSGGAGKAGASGHG